MKFSPIRPIIVVITILLLALPLSAQESENVELIGTLYQPWSWAMDVEISGDYAFAVTMNSGLRIVDISNPSAPFEVGYYDTPHSANGIAVSGSYTFQFRHNISLPESV